MEEGVQYQIDANAQILIISQSEEHADSEGVTLTAERDGTEIIGLELSVAPCSDEIINVLTSPSTHPKWVHLHFSHIPDTFPCNHG